ncbi:Transposon Ty3-I Gag-Pol polyprotein [Beauveria bassiana D1-5]|uniref:Transposon Ty3-I Gag-Pol polyprotein n=1 Tax=Beauveria bassiana D1-5 TaxID=1245745 RepID=A0A0A2W786_BEABA|nr:Transposon Ty3-I Gag-Pol polyprotein [Beauveria bassiana D1-5]
MRDDERQRQSQILHETLQLNTFQLRHGSGGFSPTDLAKLEYLLAQPAYIQYAQRHTEPDIDIQPLDHTRLLKSWRARITAYVRIRGNPPHKTLQYPWPEDASASADTAGTDHHSPPREATEREGAPPQGEGTDPAHYISGLLSPLTLTTQDSTSTSTSAIPPQPAPVPQPPASTGMASQPTPTTGLSPEAIQQITQIVQAAIAQHGRQRPESPQSQDHQSHHSRHPEDEDHTTTNRLRKNDIGFFNPDLKDQDKRGTGMITAAGKDITYVCVYAFTEQLLQHAISHGEQQVRRVWTTCLHGAAAQWYSSFLSPVEQRMLQNAPIADICEVLLDRWKPPLSEATTRLARARYTLSHASQDESIETHALRQLRDARTCGLNAQAQLQAVYDSLDPQIRALLPPPTPSDTPAKLVMALRNRWSTIRDLARQAYNRREHDRRGPPRQATWQHGRPFGGNQRFINNPNSTPPPPYQYQPLRTLPQAPAAPPSGPFYGSAGIPNPKPAYDNARNTAPRYNTYQRGNGYNNRDNPNYNTNNNNNNRPLGDNRFSPRPLARNARVHHQDGEPVVEDITDTDGPIDDWSEPCQHPDEVYGPDDYFDEVDVSAAISPAEDIQDRDVYYLATARSDAAHDGARRQACRICLAVFPSGNELHKHLAAHYDNTASYNTQTSAYSPVPREQQQILADTAPVNLADTAKDTYHVTMPPSVSLSSQEVSLRPDRPLLIITAADQTDLKPPSGMNWTYLRFWVCPDPLTPGIVHDVCADTGAAATLADERWLAQNYPDLVILRKPEPIRLKGIGDRHHIATKYVRFPLHIPGTQMDDTPAIAHKMIDVTLVDDLKANMLLGMDTLGPLGADILIGQRRAIIQACDAMTVPMTTWVQNKPSGTRVKARKHTMIAPGQTCLVPVRHKAVHGVRYIFEPRAQRDTTIFAAMLEADTHHILMRNEGRTTVRIPRSTKLGHLYPVHPEARIHAVDKQNVDMAMELAAMREPEDATRFTLTADILRENTIVHPTGVNIHRSRDENQNAAWYQMITNHAALFQDKGFALVEPEERMRVRLKPGWEETLTQRCRVYPQGPNERQVIETTTQDLLQKGKLVRTSTQVPFSFPVFVVWQGQGDKRKGRMVVDVRSLNKHALADAYPMRRQDTIMSELAHSKFITVIDAMAFYYQWQLHPDSLWAFSMITHEGQFTFRVPMMGYKNSNAYVQRHMDGILLGTKGRAYCDDIFIGSRTFPEHMHDVSVVFGILLQRNISIGPGKSYVAYTTVTVLGRMIDALDLHTTDEKLAAIRKLVFPTTLKQLESLLGFTGALRHNVPRYAMIAAPLQERKTRLQRAARARKAVTATPAEHGQLKTDEAASRRKQLDKQARAAWATRDTLTTPTRAELASFEELKRALTAHTTLAHFSVHRRFFFDVDTAKTGIGVMAYHVKDEAIPGMTQDGHIVRYPPRAAVQPVAFLSRTLSDEEKRYWATEMEVSGYIWALRKLQHFIQATDKPPVICFTDHDSIVLLDKQRDIANTTSRQVVNKKIIRAMEYASNMEVRVIHRRGIDHVVPDALSRLTTSPPHTDPAAPGQLDNMPDDRPELWVPSPIHHIQDGTSGELFPTQQLAPMPTPHASLISMSPEFKAKLRAGYDTDPVWKRVIDTVEENRKLPAPDRAELPFDIEDGLVWKHTPGRPRRLCVPQAALPDTFEAMHAGNHQGFDKLKPILDQYCIHHGAKKLRDFLRSCTKCQEYHKRTHAPYGNLQPLLPAPTPYYYISIDFIMALPPSTQGHTNILVAVCKYSKSVLTAPLANSADAAQVAKVLLDALFSNNWGIPRIMLSDRDPKFMAVLWQNVWKRMGTKLIHTTAYHPQTDGQTERVIQTISSAIRIYIASMSDPAEWEAALPRLTFQINNAPSASTGHTPNEVVKGFNPLDISDHLISTIPTKPDFASARIQAHDALAIAAVTMKNHYDRRHTTRFFHEGDMVYLRLHKGYSASGDLGRKFGRQYAGPYKIGQRVGRAAYRLELPADSRIWPVVSVDHLEPAHLPLTQARQTTRHDDDDNATHEAATPTASPPLRMTDHKIERIIDEKQEDGIKLFRVQYRDLGNAHDEWRPLHELAKHAPMELQYWSLNKHRLLPERLALTEHKQTSSP